jgi:hypothetical protein
MKTVKCPCGNDVFVLYKSQEGRKKYCSKLCKNKNYVRPFGIRPHFHNGNKGWFKRGENTGHKHPNWAGDNLTYSGVHQWVGRTLGRPKRCAQCGGKRHLQWANKSRKYLRRIYDWVALCQVCHRRFDGITKLSLEDVREIRYQYAIGCYQKTLAKKYSVDQSTISNIIRGKIKYYATA